MNKKGFTLIELLAVIIILAILMIIAVPNILSTLSTARQQAFKTQAQSIFKAAEQAFVIDSLSGSTSTNTCYSGGHSSGDHALDLGSISSTIQYKVTLSATGQVQSIVVYDSGQNLYASGTTSQNGITVATYDSSTHTIPTACTTA